MPIEKTTPPPKKTVKLFAPVGAPHAQPRKAAVKDQKALVMEKADAIVDRYIAGESIKAIAAELFPGVADWRVRMTLADSEEYGTLMQQAALNRAHNLVEEAVTIARGAALIGDAAGMRVATDTFLKVAAKLAPAEYSDRSRVELTGKDGGAMEVKADLTLSPADAYERLIGKA